VADLGRPRHRQELEAVEGVGVARSRYVDIISRAFFFTSRASSRIAVFLPSKPPATLSHRLAVSAASSPSSAASATRLLSCFSVSLRSCCRRPPRHRAARDLASFSSKMRQFRHRVLPLYVGVDLETQ
jgi:hypothetical protein